MKTNIAAIYARYSSQLQDETSIDDQLAMATRAALAAGKKVLQTTQFTDYAKSGASIHLRDGLKAMMAAAYRSEFSVLYVENLSRLSRNNGDVQKLVEQLTFLEIPIVEASTGAVLDPMNAAVKGLVAQLTREQTAQMVRRGLDGVVRSGFSAGGKAYGYLSVPRASHEKQRGGILEIIADQAEVIVEIFERYASGETPRAIAEDLNRRQIKPPRGTRWAASCIQGEASRGSGILNNELYRGVIVWNKNRMIPNPQTGRRVSRRNPKAEWVRSDAPQYRIVSDELWQSVRERKAKLAKSPAQRARAASRVFSGVLRCGACQSGMSIKGRDKSGRTRIQCTRAKESADCPDPRTYYVEDIERRVLELMRQELLEPDVIDTFIGAYEAELNKLRDSIKSRGDDLRQELKKVSDRATRLNNLLMDGLGDPARIDAELKQMVRREEELKAALVADIPSNVVRIHPSSRKRYLDAVARLHEIIGGKGQSEAAMVIREVVQFIVIHPTGEAKNRHTPAPTIEVVGKLKALLGKDFIHPPAVGGINGSGGGT